MKKILSLALFSGLFSMACWALASNVNVPPALQLQEQMVQQFVEWPIKPVADTTELEGVEQMDQKTLENLVKKLADEESESSGEGGRVQFQFNGVSLLLLSSVPHDRMRIITPIAEYASLTAEQLALAMAANFHTALDARYALSNGVLYSAYIHPLKSLTAQQVESAVAQVATLAQTFGSSYSSGALNFGGPKQAEEEAEKKSI